MRFKSKEQQAAVMSQYTKDPVKGSRMVGEPWLTKKELSRIRKFSKPTPVSAWDKEIYVIEGKKWFDKVNGNTYHAVKVIRHSDGAEIFKTNLTYGYGDQWKQTAYEGLKRAGFVKEVDRFNHELNRKRFIYSDGGYGKKSDLISI